MGAQINMVLLKERGVDYPAGIMDQGGAAAIPRLLYLYLTADRRTAIFHRINSAACWTVPVPGNSRAASRIGRQSSVHDHVIRFSTGVIPAEFHVVVHTNLFYSTEPAGEVG